MEQYKLLYMKECVTCGRKIILWLVKQPSSSMTVQCADCTRVEAWDKKWKEFFPLKVKEFEAWVEKEVEKQNGE